MSNLSRRLGKQAYCHVVGLGLGVWMVSEKQADVSVEVVRDVSDSLELKSI